ncbi:hypothetical protein OSTOST_24062 [Ostertagia ostertagi]
MRKDWRQTVYLARSKIQGLGLYAKRDIHMGDMIIEYKGEVIRSEVGEMREKRYVAQNRGVYMFVSMRTCLSMRQWPLTYDYQFELEDTTDKIPCLCGAPNCVKWMN